MQGKTRPPSGGRRAVADEDPDLSPMEGLASQRGPAQPMDIEQVEKDRAKSTGPRTDEIRKDNVR